VADSPDLTPPPEEPLPDERKAAMRHELLAATEHEAEPARRGWLAGAAAAAVVAVIAAGAYAIDNGADPDGADPGGVDQLQPADRTDATQSATEPATAPTPTPTSEPPPAPTSEPPNGEPSPEGQQPYEPPMPGDDPSTDGNYSTSCEDEIRHLFQPSLRGATVTAERDYGPGTTFLYETKTAWVACDDLTASNGGAPTLVSFHQKSDNYEPSRETLAVSDNWILDDDGSAMYAYLFAAGRDFDAVQAISYRFPDGHTEHATLGENGLWSMNYIATGGPLFDPKTSTLELDPIEVEVRYTDGDTQTFTLHWGLDTCAQLNHGC